MRPAEVSRGGANQSEAAPENGSGPLSEAPQRSARSCAVGPAGDGPVYRPFFLWRFLRSRFFRLWVAILWRLRLRPLGMGTGSWWAFECEQRRKRYAAGADAGTRPRDSA